MDRWNHVVSRRDLVAQSLKASGLAVAGTYFLTSGSVLAQTPEATPVGEATALAALDAVLQSGIDSGLVGVALRVEVGGEPVYVGAAGLASQEKQTPVTATDRFGVGSITKTFVSTLVLQLVDDGVLTLDDTVTQWLQDPVVKNIPNVDVITLRQLLSHTSGIYDYFDDDSPFWQVAYFGPDSDWTRVWTPLELLAYAGADVHAPYFAPGEGAQYSNTGYILLGLIVEKASGNSIVDQLHARIIDPLALENTFFPAGEPVPGGWVDGYHLIDGALVNVSTIDYSALWTAGGMVSTTVDLAHFVRALFAAELMSAQSLAEMMDFFAIPDRPGLEGGLGIFRSQAPNGEPLVGNDGDSPGMAARMHRIIDADFSIVMLTNTGGDEDVVNAVFAAALQASLESAVIANARASH